MPYIQINKVLLLPSQILGLEEEWGKKAPQNQKFGKMSRKERTLLLSLPFVRRLR